MWVVRGLLRCYGLLGHGHPPLDDHAAPFGAEGNGAGAVEPVAGRVAAQVPDAECLHASAVRGDPVALDREQLADHAVVAAVHLEPGEVDPLSPAGDLLVEQRGAAGDLPRYGAHDAAFCRSR